MAASRGDSGPNALLVCRVGGKVCGVALAHVVETMRPLPVEPLAHMPELTLGLSMIRGRPTPVLDARRLLGSPDTSVARRFVMLRVGLERRVALAVDEVIGIYQVSSSTLERLPAVARDRESQLVSALGALDQELLVVLEHAHLLPEDVWQTLESQA